MLQSSNKTEIKKNSLYEVALKVMIKGFMIIFLWNLGHDSMWLISDGISIEGDHISIEERLNTLVCFSNLGWTSWALHKEPRDEPFYLSVQKGKILRNNKSSCCGTRKCESPNATIFYAKTIDATKESNFIIELQQPT